MELSKQEHNGFEKVYKGVIDNKDALFYIDDADDYHEDVTFVKCEVVPNTLDKDNPGYEECVTLFFYDEVEKKKIKIDYHDLPNRIDADGKTIFDLYDYYDLKTKVRGKKKFVIDTYLFQLYNNEKLDIFTGIEVIDLDKEFYNLVNDARNFIRAKFRLSSDDEPINREKNNEKLLELANKIITRANEINDGSYLVEDRFTSTLIKHKEHEGFDEYEFNLMREDQDDVFLGVGADFYVKGNYEKAYPYYLVSSLMGNAQAISNLGYCFMYGRSVPVNKDLAIACFTLASEKNITEASYKLGTIYKYDDKYKNMDLAKEYYIKAFNSLRDYYDYVDYPSLCLEVARDKLYNSLYEKDIYGAYLLLKIAEDGYSNDLKRGFTPHEKQYNATLELLNNNIFNECKEWYKDYDEEIYLFSLEPLVKEEFSKDKIKMGDTVTLLTEVNDLNMEGKEVTLPVGFIAPVCEVHRNYLILDVYDENNDLFNGAYSLSKDKVRKYNVK